MCLHLLPNNYDSFRLDNNEAEADTCEWCGKVEISSEIEGELVCEACALEFSNEKDAELLAFAIEAIDNINGENYGAAIAMYAEDTDLTEEEIERASRLWIRNDVRNNGWPEKQIDKIFPL